MYHFSLHSILNQIMSSAFRLLLLLFSRLSRVWLSVTLWTVAHQAPLSMGFSRQAYWSGLALPSPKKRLQLEKKGMTKLDNILKSRDVTVPMKIHLVKAMVYPLCHVWMWKLDYKESWPPKIWCFWTVVLENTLEGHLDYKETQPLHPKGNQAWIYIGRTNMNLKL